MLCAIIVHLIKAALTCVRRQLLDVQLHGSQSFTSRGRLQAAAWESCAAFTVVSVSDISKLPPECAHGRSHLMPDMQSTPTGSHVG